MLIPLHEPNGLSNSNISTRYFLNIWPMSASLFKEETVSVVVPVSAKLL